MTEPQIPTLAPEPTLVTISPWRRWWWLIGLGVLLVLWLLYHFLSAKPPAASAPRPVPVVTSVAKLGDMGITLTGLGTVTPLDSVTVRSRVDGQLLRIHFKEGQLVRAGDLLAEIDPRPFQVQLMQAEGQKAKDEAAFKNAKMDLVRFNTLYDQGILAKQQLDAQVSTVIQSEASLKADQAQVESAKLNLVYSRITAPLAGRVGLRLVDAGNMVHASDVNGLVVIAPIQPISVVFTVPADNIQQVLTQDRKAGTLRVDAYDRDLKTKLATGTLLAIDNQVDPTTGTVKMKALFTNEDTQLFPNQFVNARLLVDTLKGVTIIPTAALQRSPQGSFVYVVKADSTVDMRIVEVLVSEGDRTSLKSGIAPDDVVVTDGLEKLKPGSKVSTAPPEGGARKSQ